MLSAFRIGNTGSLAVLDEHGKWLVKPAGTGALETLPAALSERIARPAEGGFWTDAGQTFYSVAMPFAGGPWTVLASMPREETQAVTWRVGTQLAMGSAITLLLAVIEVVADEVRNLAGRTREATNEISAMIGSIQSETGSAIATMEQGRQLMQDGLERNAKVASALAQISEQSDAAGEQFAAITTATSEHSSTATVLSANLQSIAQANGEQRQVVANLADTARELDHLASQLRQEVERFR